MSDQIEQEVPVQSNEPVPAAAQTDSSDDTGNGEPPPKG